MYMRKNSDASPTGGFFTAEMHFPHKEAVIGICILTTAMQWSLQMLQNYNSQHALPQLERGTG